MPLERSSKLRRTCLGALLIASAACCAACSGSTESPEPNPSGLDGGTSDASEAGQADVVVTADLPFGRCCGKPEDCASKRCAAVEDGPYYCTQSCQPYPDDCPVGFLCEESVDACIPVTPSSYSCDP